MINKKDIIISIVFGVFALLHASWFVDIPVAIYYSGFMLLAVIMLFKCKGVNVVMALFMSACAFSVLGNDIPPVFQPWLRWVSFSIVLTALSPLLLGDKSDLLKRQIYKTLNILLTIAIVISFIGYLLQIPSFAKVGLLNGVFGHSMILGPVSAIVFLIGLDKFSTTKILDKFLNIIILFISAVSCLLSGSRGAFVSLVGASFCLLFLKYKNSFYLILKSLFLFIFVTIVTFPIWSQYCENIAKKQQENIRVGGTFASRENLWRDRINEFKSSPVIGIGFASVDVRSMGSFSDKGIVEPGSSWLFLLSSIGLLGTLFFATLIITPFVYFFTRQNLCIEMPYLLSTLFFFVIHFCIEGYILASGSSLFCYFWLSLGVVYGEMKSENSTIN